MEQETKEKTVSHNNREEARSYRYFSESARQQIVKEIEDGLYSKAEAARVYKVHPSSIYNWLTKYSLSYQKQLRTVVETESDSVKRKKLESQVSDLQKIIGQQAVETYFYKELLEFVSTRYDFDFKKNINTMSLVELEQIKRDFGHQASH
jgi:transposase-like protein